MSEQMEKAEKISALFEQAGADYVDDVLKKARQSVDELETDGYASQSDYESALLSLPSALYAFHIASFRARSDIKNLPDDVRGFAWDSFENKKLPVRQQMKSAYFDAVRIIEDGAIDYCIKQFDFVADIDSIPAEKRKKMFRKAWDATVRIKNGARLSRLMESFEEMLGALDYALTVSSKN